MADLVTPGGHRLGLKWQGPDHQDHVYSARATTLKALPPFIDPRNTAPPPPTQNDTGSCTGCGGSYLMDFLLRHQGLQPIVGSRYFLYYNERRVEGSIAEDSGATIRDQMKMLAQFGIPLEAMWPYDKSLMFNEPGPAVYEAAMKHQLLEYAGVPLDAQQIMGAVAEGLPVSFGFQVFNGYENFPSGGTGIVPMPRSGERPLGGHNNVIVGYDDTRARYGSTLFLVANWWNDRANNRPWGLDGYCWMPDAFITNPKYCADFWIGKLAEGDTPPPPPPPKPPLDSFDVGPGVRAAMTAEGDWPATNEDYPRRVDGSGSGYSVTEGVKGNRYEYVASTNNVRVFEPKKVY